MQTLLTLGDFTNASVSVNEGTITLNLGLSKASGSRIRSFTAANVGKKLAFIVNGHLLKAPKIKDPIDGDGLSIDPLDRGVADKRPPLAFLASKL